MGILNSFVQFSHFSNSCEIQFRQIFSIFEKKMLSEIVQEVILQPDVKKKRENTSAIWYQVQIEVFQYITKH